MKKIQCEVCGGVSLKRNEDGLFECQNCGVQYEREQLSKLCVQIDHAPEVENLIERGKNFEASGDQTRAKEYYDKALDLDAKNQVAQRAIEKIDEKEAWKDCYIIERQDDVNQSFYGFIKTLAFSKDLPEDFFEHIRIKSLNTEYVCAYRYKFDLEYKYSVIVGNYYYSYVTVMEEKYDYNLGRRVTKPVTKEVKNEERIPTSGTKDISETKVSFDERILKETGITIAEFADYLKKKVIKPIDMDSLIPDSSGNYMYAGCTISLPRIDVYNLKRAALLKQVNQEVPQTIKKSIKADFLENYSESLLSQSVAGSLVFVPVQRIEYSYKDQAFSGVAFAWKSSPQFCVSYPKIDNSFQLIVSNNSRPTPPRLDAGIIFSIFCFILSVVFACVFLKSSNENYYDYLAIVIAPLILAMIFLIVGVKHEIQSRKEYKENLREYHDKQVATTQANDEREKKLKESYESYKTKFENRRKGRNIDMDLIEDIQNG